MSELLSVAEELAEVTRLVDGDDLEATLGRFVDRIVATVPGCHHASITIASGDGLETVAGVQEPKLVDLPTAIPAPGPVLEAVLHGEPRKLADSRVDQRWPEFNARMADCGFRSALVLPLPAQASPGAAVAMFSRDPDKFLDTSYDMVLLFVLHAGVVFDNAKLYHDCFTLVGHLRTALTTRSTVGQAQGLLMHRGGLDTERSFTALRVASQHANVKLRDVAAALVEAHNAGRLEDELTLYKLRS
jgi:hypothetical protein